MLNYIYRVLKHLILVLGLYLEIRYICAVPCPKQAAIPPASTWRIQNKTNHLVWANCGLALVFDLALALALVFRDLALALALLFTAWLMRDDSIGGGSTPGRLVKIFFGARYVLGKVANGLSARCQDMMHMVLFRNNVSFDYGVHSRWWQR